MTDTHNVTEDHAITESLPDHPARADSAEYRKSHARMVELAKAAMSPYGNSSIQDHHGGGLWAWSDDDPQHGTPFCVRNLVGLEWSSQWVAAPAKVDRLRANAVNFYSVFPQSAAALGLRDVLDTPITDAAGVARFVDSLLNASVPLPQTLHVGLVEQHGVAGAHHYPAPLVDVQLVCRDDWPLWVTDGEGHPVAVTDPGPSAQPGSVEVQWAHPSSAHAAVLHAAHHNGTRHIVGPEHQLAQDHARRRAASAT